MAENKTPEVIQKLRDLALAFIGAETVLRDRLEDFYEEYELETLYPLPNLHAMSDAQVMGFMQELDADLCTVLSESFFGALQSLYSAELIPFELPENFGPED